MPSLPDRTFDEIAVDLFLYAGAAHDAAMAGEIMLARTGGEAPGLTAHLSDLRAAAAMAGQLYQFFREAAPHEQLIRDFLAGVSVLPASAGQLRVVSG